MFIGLLLVSDGTNINRTKSSFHAGERVKGYTLTSLNGSNTYYTSPTTDTDSQRGVPNETPGGTPGIEVDNVDSLTPVPLSTLTALQGQPLAINLTLEDNTVHTEQLNGKFPVAATGAAATAIVTGGGVTGFTITNPGTGYFQPPSVILTGGGGTGAVATAQVNPVTGLVTQISVGKNGGGSGYTTAPTVSFGPFVTPQVNLLERGFNADNDSDLDAPEGDETDRQLHRRYMQDLALLIQGQAVDLETGK